MDVLREIIGFITKVFFEITDLLFKFEDFIFYSIVRVILEILNILCIY